MIPAGERYGSPANAAQHANLHRIGIPFSAKRKKGKILHEWMAAIGSCRSYPERPTWVELSGLRLGERFHYRIEVALDDDVVSLFEIDGAGLISSSVTPNEADMVRIDSEDIAIGRLKFHVSVHGIFGLEPDGSDAAPFLALCFASNPSNSAIRMRSGVSLARPFSLHSAQRLRRSDSNAF